VRAGSAPAMKGPDEWFTGSVRIEPAGAIRTGMAVVNFEPGARTNWHIYPMGQVLLVTDGVGWTQCEGGPCTEIRPGDLIYCNYGRCHWHGATDTTCMPHVAIQESVNGSPVEWMEPVSDEQYLAGPVKKD